MNHFALTATLILLGGFCSVSTAQLAHQDYVEILDDVSLVMKAIEGGTYSYGCGLEDEPCIDEEWSHKAAGQRQRLESVEPFYLAETETTWALYQLCIDAGACPNNDADGGDNGWGKGSRPVIEVSWIDVTESFLPWLNQRTGKSYRLPTEVEWEYAARAGTRQRIFARRPAFTTIAPTARAGTDFAWRIVCPPWLSGPVSKLIIRRRQLSSRASSKHDRRLTV